MAYYSIPFMKQRLGPGKKRRLRLKSAASIFESKAGVKGCDQPQHERSVSRLWGGGSAGEAHSEVRDALEDRVNETVGAMELTEDYYTCRDSCHTHALTHLEHNVCVCLCVCTQRRYTMLQSKQCWCNALQQVGLQAGEMSVTYVDILSIFVPIHALTCTPHQH